MSWATSCHGFGLRTPGGSAHQQDSGTSGSPVPNVHAPTSASVFTGQVRVMLKPASIKPMVIEFQASFERWVNITTMMPS